MRYLNLIIVVLLFPAIAEAQSTVEIYDFEYSLKEPVEKLTPKGDRLYFVAKEGAHGKELWSIDNVFPQRLEADEPKGSADGIYTDGDKSFQMGKAGDNIYYFGFYKNAKGISTNCVYEFNIPNQTTTVIDTLVTSVFDYVSHKGSIYFTATRAGKEGLYTYNHNTKTFSILIEPQNKGNHRTPRMAVIGDAIYYSGYRQSMQKAIYEYDLNTNTEKLIAGGVNTPTATYLNWFYDMIAVGNTLFFTARNNQHGIELYRYDSIAPQRLTDIGGGLGGGISSNMLIQNGTLYFLGAENTAQPQKALYSYNISSYTLKKLVNLDKVSIGFDGTWGNIYNNKIFYPVYSYPNSPELHYYDIANNQINVADITIIGTSNKALPNGIPVTMNNVLFYPARDSATNRYVLAKYTDAGLSVATTKGSKLTTTLYPNPTTGNATLEFNLKQAQTLSLHLTDVTGRTVYQKAAQQYEQGKHQAVLPTQSLSAGVYMYQVRNSDGELLSKGRLVKE